VLCFKFHAHRIIWSILARSCSYGQLNWFSLHVVQGKSDAAYQMALMRVDGVGAPMDYKKALMWLELAGKPSDVSYQLLITWFTQAAEQVS